MTHFDSIFIATGSNLGNRLKNLLDAKKEIECYLELIAESRIYESPAIDYLNQPDFYNQVLEFKLPILSANNVMILLLNIEQKLGRNRIVLKGPRLIDLDLLFWGLERFQSDILEIPHPRLFERSFVVLPLIELPGFKMLQQNFDFNFQFNNHARALS